MKVTKILALAVSAIVVFASCSNEDSNSMINNGEEKTVMLKINRVGETKTRAEGANTGDETSIAFSGGKLYFTKTDGSITKVLNVVTSGVTNESQINVNLESAQTITGVPAASTKVYIAGNVSDLPISGNISGVTGKLVSVTSQHDEDGGVANVAIYGTNNLNPGVGENDPYTASVNVKPICGRIEIDKFTATGSVISGYRIDGIFINNYYSQIKLSGVKSGTATPADDLIVNATETDGQVPTIYTSPSSKYPTADNAKYFDFAATGIGNLAAKVYTPVTGATWAYNLLAPTSGAAPRIVIRFSNIASTPLITETYRYITVSGFADVDDDSNTPLAFEAGKIYRIKNFTFDESDLDILPEMETITAKVTVTLTTWSELDVKPIH